MFEKILIANRGEIAVRIIRTAQEMGLRTIAVYSELDRDALHVQLADEAWNIGPPPAAESYLNSARILQVARAAKAEATANLISASANGLEMTSQISASSPDTRSRWSA